MDFLPTLPQVFRERFLNTHCVYLKAISYTMGKMYTPEKMYAPNNLEEMSSQMLIQLQFQKPHISKKRQDPGYETPEFRNLRNCWYHECALNYPFENRDERLRFASWKIIQCYYTVLSSIAALVRCYFGETKSIDRIVNIYTSEFLCNRERKGFVLPPLNLYLNRQGVVPEDELERITWYYAKHYGIPEINKCLQSVHETDKVTSIPHYLRSLRDWVTYQDAYLLFRLYGESPKIELDISLTRIAFAYALQAEFFLINLFGWDAFASQFTVFSNELKNNLKIESPTLLARYKAYSTSNLAK